MAAHHPELLESALLMERRALTGRHSRFDDIEFGATWLDTVKSGGRFPSSTTTVGLGRSFSWNHWAISNDVADSDFVVKRDPADRARFALLADLLRSDDNALDGRSPTKHRTIKIARETAQLDLF